MMKLVRVQAYVRGFLYRAKYRQLKNNPALYDDLYPDLVSMKASTIPYLCEATQEVISKLGPFRFEDEKSEEMLQSAGGNPTQKPL